MKQTEDFYNQAETAIRRTLDKLSPKLLEVQGRIGHSLKADKSAVTEMDVLVETELKAALADVDPGINFKGEETGGREGETYWLVDPIDGTQPFIRGAPFSTNMIALIDGGRPVMSVINNFFLHEFYLAVKGRGASMNGHPIRVSRRPFKKAMIIGNFNPTLSKSAEGLYDRLGKNMKHRPVRLAAAGYEFALVAKGALDGRISFMTPEQPHDLAPGMLLVSEAGGMVGSIEPGEYDMMSPDAIASNPPVFAELRRLVREHISG